MYDNLLFYNNMYDNLLFYHDMYDNLLFYIDMYDNLLFYIDMYDSLLLCRFPRMCNHKQMINRSRYQTIWYLDMLHVALEDLRFEV